MEEKIYEYDNFGEKVKDLSDEFIGTFFIYTFIIIIMNVIVIIKNGSVHITPLLLSIILLYGIMIIFNYSFLILYLIKKKYKLKLDDSYLSNYMLVGWYRGYLFSEMKFKYSELEGYEIRNNSIYIKRNKNLFDRSRKILIKSFSKNELREVEQILIEKGINKLNK